MSLKVFIRVSVDGVFHETESEIPVSRLESNEPFITLIDAIRDDIRSHKESEKREASFLQRRALEIGENR